MQAMQKRCWFILGQPYYDAPKYNEDGEPTGPLLLGHLLPSPVAAGKPINRIQIEKFHSDMNISSYPIKNFAFQTHPVRTREANLEIGVPLAAAAGITVNAGIGAFARYATGTSWTIEQLDVLYIDPTDAYINHVVESSEVKTWVEGHKSLTGAWSLFMVTGLMIARRAHGETTRSTEQGPHATLGLDVPAIATGALSAGHAQKDEICLSGDYPQHFVWAIRVSRIRRGHFSRQPKAEEYTEGATLSSTRCIRQDEMSETLTKEGLVNNDAWTIEASWESDFSHREQHFFIANPK